ncbi:MAG: hypothetical protein EOP61_00615 [Sphingomonadales bacterium]|nr:MAG: hypothetical protein EOP61_00615 [Sphingomonadales bacterium]
MDDPVLFTPDNRLLGAAIGDLGMFGGQGHAPFSVHGASADAPVQMAAQLQAGDRAETLTSAEPSDRALSGDLATAVAQSNAGAGALAPQPFLIAPAAAEFAPIQHVLPSEGVAPLQPHEARADQGAGSLTSAPAEHAPATSGETPLMGPAAGLLDDLSAGPVLGGGTGLVDDVLAPVGGLLGGAADLVDDTLEGLAGSDPAGGVATLVNLVSIADTFDLTPVVAPLVQTVSDTGQGLVDVLLGEDSLLGDPLHDGVHLLPDHPLGL